MEMMAYKFVDKEALLRVNLSNETYARVNEDFLTYLANQFQGKRFAPTQVEQKLQKLSAMEKETAECCSVRVGQVLAFCAKKAKDGTSGRKTAPWVWNIGLAKKGSSDKKEESWENLRLVRLPTSL